ncbi:hypothetical protein MNBD_NITROSPINAE05-339 [hydrothermal vent metagenome]|uniref:Flagellar protein FlaG n=1 Tax=hydrothermal vent metagenome TaxID=652676 RepID=A0A3B1D446_9ZZZZ
MDSASINPARGPDIQTTQAPASAAKPVQKPPKAEVKAAPKDTVSLSPAAKDALESSGPEVSSSPVSSARPADIPDSGNADSGVDNNSRRFSVTEAKDVVVTIVDKKTQEVIKQIPSEEVLDLRNAIRDGVEKIAPKDNPTEKLI